jgi:hypothetical protein
MGMIITPPFISMSMALNPLALSGAVVAVCNRSMLWLFYRLFDVVIENILRKITPINLQFQLIYTKSLKKRDCCSRHLWYKLNHISAKQPKTIASPIDYRLFMPKN